MSFKIVSIQLRVKEACFNLLNLPTEMLDHVLSFCDKTALLKLSLTNSNFLMPSQKALAKIFQLDWGACKDDNVFTTELLYRNPMKFLSNLTVPLVMCEHVLSWLESRNLDVNYIQSLITLYPDAKLSLPYFVTNVGKSFASLLEDGTVVVWDRKKGWEPTLYPIKSGASTVHTDSFVYLNSICTSNRTILDLSRSKIDSKFLRGRKIKSYYRNGSEALAQLDDSKVVFLNAYTPFDGDRKKHFSIPEDRTVRDLKISKVQLFATLLDNGEVWFWRKSVAETGAYYESYDSVGLDEQKVHSLTSNGNSFVMVMEDLRTIMQRGYLSDTHPTKTFDKIVLQFRERADIKSVFSNEFAHVALLSNGKIAVWGDPNYGGNAPSLPKHYSVHAIYKTMDAFLIIFKDGRGLSWGGESHGNSPMPELPPDRTIKAVFTSRSSFVALLDDKTILVWGEFSEGGRIPSILLGCPVATVFSNASGFIALLEDGRVCYWGRKCMDGKMISIPDGDAVKFVFPTRYGFVIQLESNYLLPIGVPSIYISHPDDFSQGLLPPLPKDKKRVSIDGVSFSKMLDTIDYRNTSILKRCWDNKVSGWLSYLYRYFQSD